MENIGLRIAENAALLGQICDKPMLPTRNDPIAVNVLGDRTVSFQEELEIVNCVNYLASYSDHPGEVMALCMEELPSHKGLIITVATNTGSTVRLEDGLRDMADVLQQQNNDYAQRVNPELKQSRRHLFNLAEEFGYLSQLSVTSNHDESAGASSVRSLVAIAKIVSKMWKRHGDLLPKLIASVPNFDMDPLRRLLSFAGRFRVFGSIQILPIHFKPYDLSIALDRHRSDLQQQRLQAVTQSLRVTNAWQQKLGDAKINEGAPSQPEPLQSADETGKPFTCVFDETEPYLRFHTPKIHVEISHEEAQRLADINPPSNHEKMLVAITIEVTWLGSDESNEMTTPKDHSINLDSRWTELTAVDGILFTDEGLLMRKGDDIVRVRALHVDSHQGERKDSLHD
ncbi:predicted protein [Pyrenophora tritici-repentis Pt-1C-BFP]|uniref:Uncharacterized protein n=1 Tax=Pyrenophora tritici-repentis (strain Pt-1C-BFP) TaxID=426418 RepID=B2WD80_PYRTR|nr:uncharacterized protein PTRG_07939 [Pyrenophora tritici-repentis Pt-1C-BFP]EDU50858.1 predicted protein [Pyrenophora tritici-repentis Pt-1C-BFP]